MDNEVKVQLQPENRGQFRLNNKTIVCRECIRLAGNQIGRSFCQAVDWFFLGVKEKKKNVDSKRFAHDSVLLLKALTEEAATRFLTATHEEAFRDGAQKAEDQIAKGRGREESLEDFRKTVAKHRLYITSTILTLRGPNRRGLGAIPSAHFQHSQRRHYDESVRTYLLLCVPQRCRTALLDAMERDLSNLGLCPLLVDPALASPGQPTRLSLARRLRARRAFKAVCAMAAVGLRLLGRGGAGAEHVFQPLGPGR